ncbi:MAG: hypothetical protein ACFB01_12895 [Cohaesibacteraceae bacterium]
MKISLAKTALAGGLVLGTLAATMSVTQARTFTEDEYINRDRCYEARRIPALVEYNTRGHLVSTSSRHWVGNPQVDGSLVVNHYNDPVYIQTRRILEDQHVTLVPVAC